MNQLKKHEPFKDQVQLLEQRDMIIEDKTESAAYLSRRNYYRLNVYFHKFQSKDATTNCPTYKQKVSFGDIKAIEECDSYLRHLIFRYIEAIELKLRTLASYYSSKSFGANAFETGNCFDDQKTIKINSCQQSFKDLGKEIFANQLSLILRPFSQTTQSMMATAYNQLCVNDQKVIRLLRKKYPVEYHHVLKYGSKFPTWVLIEFLSFGDLSKIFRYLKETIQEEIGRSFNIFGTSKNYQHKQQSKKYNTHGNQKRNEFFFSSWLHCLSTVRNICAHHGYLFRRKLDITPSKRNDFFQIYLGFSSSGKKNQGNIFDAIVCIYSILTEEERKSFATDFEDFINWFQKRKATRYMISLSDYGIPRDWKRLFQQIDAEIVRVHRTMIV